ncbi:BLUF domain-containing protein [Sulfitobacter guttiformis]|uniref:BLUF domain-containing protein n=1 Tax=Sulfitobacter guttiformis TaxID=74349 RepID=UPI0022B4CFB9|nr:BLUF domain-containing protein [Sulfitobacter guttiformis]
MYVSQPFGYDMPSLSGILLDARKHNLRDGITGALICRHDIYLQLLEGPSDKVQAAAQRIGRDDRHVGMKILLSESVADRMFGQWAMLHDPAKTVIWSEAEIADDILNRTTPAEIMRVFEALADQMEQGVLPDA